jgi:hypothetical protein
MSFLINFRSTRSRDCLCMACTNVQGSPKAILRGMIWGRVNLQYVAKAGKPPMKQSKNSALSCEILYAILSANHFNAHGHFLASCFGALRMCTSHRQCLLQDNWG